MTRASYGTKWGRVRSTTVSNKGGTVRSPEEVVRDIKKEQQGSPREDYRDRSLAIHGLVCGRCGRNFEESTKHLLTVHHKDGNHFNNAPDGSNWENLCAYCHEDVHSRHLLGDYLQGQGASVGQEHAMVYDDSAGGADTSSSGMGLLGEKLRKAMEQRGKASK